MRLAALAVILATGLAVGVAHAQGAGQPPSRALQAQRLQAMFARFDLDKDGRITESEVEAARDARFAGADANRDGVLDAAEFARARRAETPAAAFEALDLDGDDALDPEELAQRTPMFMRRMDADGDGAVTRDEAAAFQESRRDRRGTGQGATGQGGIGQGGIGQGGAAQGN